jgi:CheY-like chemotaxis protein
MVRTAVPSLTSDSKKGKSVVLLIEDDPKSAKLIADYLQDFDYAMEVVSSGEEGLEKARSLKPLFIILDIVLPHKDGWDVLIELKMDPLTKDIPILVTTILQDSDKGLALGAADYLIKPIAKNDLDEAIAKVISLQIKKNGPINVLAVDDDVLSLRIIEAILKPKGFQIFKAENGPRGLEIAFRERPDLILLDLVMPGMTGFDVIVHLRNEPVTKDIPIIVITAKLLSKEEKQLLKSQTEIILEKSKFSKETLLREIDLILRC